MKGAFTAVVALGFGLAGATLSHAAPTGAPAGATETAPLENAVRLAQTKEEVIRGAPSPAPRAAPGGAYAPKPGAGGPPRGGYVPRGAYVPRGGYAGPRYGVVGPGPGYVPRGAYYGRSAFVRPYRRWYRRPHFGTIVGGVALGTILTVAAVGVAPAYPPAPDLCWYWADPSMTTGYWDYCY